MDFTPKFDNVLIEEDAARERMRRGIVTPAGIHDEQVRRGVVLAVGPGRHYDGVMIENTVEVGQKVVFEPHAGFTVKIGSTEYVVMREGKICGTYKGDEVQEADPAGGVIIAP